MEVADFEPRHLGTARLRPPPKLEQKPETSTRDHPFANQVDAHYAQDVVHPVGSQVSPSFSDYIIPRVYPVLV